MKTLKTLTLLVFLLSVGQTNAQFFKKLKERAAEAAKETILQKSEEKSAEKTGQVMDSLFEAPTRIGKKDKKGNRNVESQFPELQDEIMVNANFDFEAGSNPIFTDDFSLDRVGDFPAKWDTNGSGEIVMVEDEKWFRLANNSVYNPGIGKDLPENYTIEFDLLTTGLDNQTSSQAFLTLFFSSDPRFEKGNTWSMVEISPCQYIGGTGAVQKVVTGNREFRNNIDKDYREAINGYSRISIAVNKTRLRLWLNENKIVDVPRLIGEGTNHFKMATRGLRDERNVDELFIKDFQIAVAGEDYRSKLLTEGSISTNAILFASASATLKPESNAIIEEIASVLQENLEVNIKIIGHTDADGDEGANLELSKERAQAVKTAMINQYGIEEFRIITDGKGESQPIAGNDTAEGKSENRRVEFIKL